jgi:hypothetical protein
VKQVPSVLIVKNLGVTNNESQHEGEELANSRYHVTLTMIRVEKISTYMEYFYPM